MPSSSAASTPPPRVLPPGNPANEPYWIGGASGRLLIAWCAHCDRLMHPPTEHCANCTAALQYVPVSGNGTVFTFSVSHQQFHPDVPTPFVIAIIELAEQPGLRVVANIVDCDPNSVRVGMTVAVRFERHQDVFVPVFTPAD